MLNLPFNIMIACFCVYGFGFHWGWYVGIGLYTAYFLWVKVNDLRDDMLDAGN